MLIRTKTLTLKNAKGADVTPGILDKINKYAQDPLKIDDVYVQKYIMAHNGIDRDRERFPEDLLNDFARTITGKSFLEVHDKSRLPIGLYFDAETEEMTKEQFKSLTGEDILLPDDIAMAMVVNAWIYTPRKDWNQKLIDNLASGIFRHASIGFSATGLKPVKGEFDQVLYSEYEAPGEAREGSIVYLGAQQGATIQKNAKQSKCPLSTTTDDRIDDDIAPDDESVSAKCPLTVNLYDADDSNCSLHDKEEGKYVLKTSLVSKLKSEKEEASSSSDGERQEALDDISPDEEKSSFVSKETDGNKEGNLPASKSEMEKVGREYRKELEDNWIAMKTTLGDVSYDAISQEQARNVVESLELDYLKDEVKALEKRMNERLKSSKIKSDDKLNDDDISIDDKDELPPGAYYYNDMLVVPQKTLTPGVDPFVQQGLHGVV